MRSGDDLDDVTRPHGPQGDWAVGVADPIHREEFKLEARSGLWSQERSRTPGGNKR